MSRVYHTLYGIRADNPESFGRPAPARSPTPYPCPTHADTTIGNFSPRPRTKKEGGVPIILPPRRPHDPKIPARVYRVGHPPHGPPRRPGGRRSTPGHPGDPPHPARRGHRLA